MGLMGDSTEPMFRPGDRVAVREERPRTHHRTPAYVKGKRGWVAVLCGVFPNPETRAYGGAGLPERALYRIEFEQRELWGDRYTGPSGDRLLVDIYEHWLEPAD